MRKIFLVDSENTNDYSFLDLEIAKDDKIIIFVSNGSKNITCKTLEKLLSSKVCVEFIHSVSGFKNAMDFCIISYLTKILIEECRDDLCIYITSDDNCYINLSEFVLNITNPKCKLFFSLNQLKKYIKSPEYSSLDFNMGNLSDVDNAINSLIYNK